MAHVIQKLTTPVKGRDKKPKEQWIRWGISNDKVYVSGSYPDNKNIPNLASLPRMPDLEITKDQFERYWNQNF